MALRLHRARALILIMSLLAATGARASEDAAAQPAAAHGDGGPGGWRPASPAQTRWCGWQAFLVDAAWMGVYAGSAKAGSVPGMMVGSAGYLAGVPILRSIHGDGGGWSLLRRVAFPFAGGLLGAGIGSLALRGRQSDECSEGCGILILSALGVGAGMVGAMGYDWITAREPAPAETATAPAWTPMVVATPRMRGVAVALRF